MATAKPLYERLSKNMTAYPPEEAREMAFMLLDHFADRTDDVPIVDIGTGSGCIAITLARFLPQSVVTGWDVSEEALTLARRNAQHLNADVQFAIQDILNVSVDFAKRFDCVVSNPPYVTRSEAAGMDRNVLDYEPGLALFVEDSDPLVFYKAVADFCIRHLTKDGACYVEINERFGEATRQVFAERGFGTIQVYKDIHGKDRSIRATF